MNYSNCCTDLPILVIKVDRSCSLINRLAGAEHVSVGQRVLSWQQALAVAMREELACVHITLVFVVTGAASASR